MCSTATAGWRLFQVYCLNRDDIRQFTEVYHYLDNLYINSILPTHRFSENNFRLFGPIGFGVVCLWPTSKGQSFCGGKASFHSTRKITLKLPLLTNKPPVAMKFTGGSHCGASLLWVSLFGSSLPYVWLARKIEAQKTSNTNSSHNFASNLTKLSRPSGSPEQCVISWFSLASTHAYQGFQVGFFANCHKTCTE